jgi:hypothetical protein
LFLVGVRDPYTEEVVVAIKDGGGGAAPGEPEATGRQLDMPDHG